MVKRYRKYLFKGKKYRTFEEIAKIIGKHPSNVSRYYKKHGTFEGINEVHTPVKVGFLSQQARNSARSIQAYLKPCVCGKTNPFLDNLHGWTTKTIRCRYCGREASGEIIDEAIVKWNNAYRNEHQEGFV